MKKIKFLLSLMLVTLGLVGLASCADDHDSNPVMNTSTAPTSFTVNTPADAEQYIQLSKENTVHLTWSQPNYEFVALAHYFVQVGLFDSAASAIKWNTNEKTGANSFLETSYTQCSADLNGEEIAWAINNLDGYKTASDYQDKGYRNVYFRIYSCLQDGQGNEVANSGIFSNEICFKNMAAYNAIKEKGTIYLVGNVTGWNEPKAANAAIYEDWKLTETEIGSNIYEGTFTMNESAPQFRFWTKLTGWDQPESIGLDSNTDCELKDGVYTGTISQDTSEGSKGKGGNYTIVGFTSGKQLKITVDLANGTVRFQML